MESNLWQQIQDLYLDALERAPHERGAFLDAACASDPQLRAEIDSLLVAGGGSDPLFDATLDDLLLLVDDEPVGREAALPERAGPYAILEQIGQGGMGVVYRARRDDGQYTRDVALKLVHALGPAADVSRRFRRERQILATLEHPNIARLYDAGVSPDGRPYLAMELVLGEPIHRYSDGTRLTVEARLALFEQVVSAVDYAHRKLVIHRDLKPSNILVTEAGVVKLLDFGIAKLIEGDGALTEDDTPLTRLDQRLLTPEYASPEQLRGEALSTASDVYSLGVLLHHLLVGRRPEGPAITSPSTVLNTVEAAAARATTPARLRRQLKGELDTILLRALRAEPEARYPSAAALLEDLVRYRSGLPLRARPPSLGYRTRKFVARNAVPVAAGGAALFGLVGGLGLALHQARVARQERDLAQSVSGFLVNTFSAADPFMRNGERLDTMRIQSFLNRAVERLDTDLAEQPEVRTRMQGVLGNVHEALGLYEPARILMDASLEGNRRLHGEDSPEVAESLKELGGLQQASGDAAGAEASYRQALDLARRRFGGRSREVAQIQTELAGTLLTQERLAEAEEALSAAIQVRREEFGDVSGEMADNLNLLAVLQYRQGKLDEAIVTMEQALTMIRDLVGPDHPNAAVLAQNLGLALHRRGRYAEAEPLLRESVLGLERSLGPDYPNLGAARKTLANVLEALERWPEADSLYQNAVDFSRRVQGDSHPDLGIALHDFGGALMKRGELLRAEPMLEESLRIARALGPGNPAIGIVMGTLAELYRKQGDLRRAQEAFQESVDELSRSFPSNHPRVLSARGGLALCRAGLGQTTEAEIQLLQIYEEAQALEEGGLAAHAAARGLATYYGLIGNRADSVRWQALGAQN